MLEEQVLAVVEQIARETGVSTGLGFGAGMVVGAIAAGFGIAFAVIATASAIDLISAIRKWRKGKSNKTSADVEKSNT